MADDFGDDAGGKLLDWSIRIMIEGGRHHARESASRLAGALRDAGDRAAAQGSGGAPAAAGRGGWAKLDLRDFTGIDGWDDLRGIVDGALSRAGIAHEWFDDEPAGRQYLLFRTADARGLADEFGRLAERVEEAHGEAERAMDRAREAGRDGRGGRERDVSGRPDPRRDRSLGERVLAVRRYAAEAGRAGRDGREAERNGRNERGRS